MKKLLIIALALVASLGAVSTASANGRDRNHDKLPDRWERAHHLSLKVKQAKKDQDRDGLNNHGEWRARMNPRDDDSDDDGVEDGDENAGTIKSFEGGVLTITLAGGGELSGTVDDETEIECHGKGDLKAHSSSDDEDGDDDGPNHDADDDHGDDDGPNHDADDDHADGDHEHGDHEHGDDEDGDDVNEHGDDDDDQCSADALKAGTKVHEAELEISSNGKHWDELELLAP